jgi:hypothetical protein
MHFNKNKHDKFGSFQSVTVNELQPTMCAYPTSPHGTCTSPNMEKTRGQEEEEMVLNVASTHFATIKTEGRNRYVRVFNWIKPIVFGFFMNNLKNNNLLIFNIYTSDWEDILK